MASFRSVSHGFFRTIWTLLVTVVCIGIITGCIVAAVLTVYVLKTVDQTEVIDLNNIKLNYTTIIYAPDAETGDYIELQRLHGDENRIWVDYENIPQDVVNAVISTEDKRFRSHQGVDWKRTLSSAINMFIRIYPTKQGGSTITQQLIKNYTQDDSVTISRKVREIFHAISLEKSYSKDQIMEAYLNTISLGNNTNGVQAAANLYFDKDVSQLTLAESAALISITKNPTQFNPFRHPDNLKERQEWVLYNMLDQGMISQEQYDRAVAAPLVIAKETASQKTNAIQNWFVDQVFQDVVDDLMDEYNITEGKAITQILRGGYRIYTTVDNEMQEYLEEHFIWDTDTFPNIINNEYPEAAFVILDHNGAIKAIVGSNRVKEGSRLFSRARDAVRHPGSTIKPLASYTPAIESNLIHYSSLVEDSPIVIGQERDINGEFKNTYWPKNFYTNPSPYLGDITVNIAVRRSCNTIPAKLQKQMGSGQVAFNFLKNKLGFQSLVEAREINGKIYSDINLSPMALGEMTEGVSPLEMAGGYQIFGNGGLFTKPYSYTKVLDSEGNVILEKNTTPVRVISEETATIVNHLLQEVTTMPWGTGTNAPFSAMPVAGKTGTSDSDFNQWFIGVTPYYVGVCWMGYDIADTIKYYTYPPPIVWKNIMAPIHEDLPIIPFENRGNVVSFRYCTVSGERATENCPTTGVGWYKANNVPGYCAYHDPSSPTYLEGVKSYEETDYYLDVFGPVEEEIPEEEDYYSRRRRERENEIPVINGEEDEE